MQVGFHNHKRANTIRHARPTSITSSLSNPHSLPDSSKVFQALPVLLVGMLPPCTTPRVVLQPCHICSVARFLFKSIRAIDFISRWSIADSVHPALAHHLVDLVLTSSKMIDHCRVELVPSCHIDLHVSNILFPLLICHHVFTRRHNRLRWSR